VVRWTDEGSAGGRGGRCLHPDLEVGDVALLLEQLQAIWVGDPKCGSELRHLHLTLLLGSLHTSQGRAPLPGPPPTIDRLRRRLRQSRCQSTSHRQIGVWRSGRIWHLT
jgi:hypothetical protein